MLTKTKDRQNLVAQLRATYTAFDVADGHGRGLTIEWALVTGAAEIAADALLANPESDYWRCEFPLETSGDGAALRWLRETLSGDVDADARFAAYARTPGCEVPRRTADAVRWMIQRNLTAAQAISALNIDSVDSPLAQLEDVAPHVRERLIRALPAAARAHLRETSCDYIE